MKSTSYALNELDMKAVKLEQLDPDSIDPETRADALLHAGVDKYVGGVGFFRLLEAWRRGELEHPKGALVVRHINSSGYQVTVCESQAAPPAPPAPPLGSTSTPASSPEAGAAAAVVAVQQLEQQREEQRAKDAPANDNKETAPIAPTGTSTP